MSRTIDIIARGMAKNGGGGSGEVSDIKVDGRSIVKPDGTAELATESPYDPETNPLATMNDVGGGDISSLVTSVTYAQLKTLRDTSKLVPGMKYRITDFVTTTQAADLYRSAGHPFDVIVTALSANTLSEDASAHLHSADDSYFQKAETEVLSADWADPELTIRDVHCLYSLSNGTVYNEDVPNQNPTSGVITQLGKKANPDGLMVPAMLNPDAEGDGGIKWHNNVVTIYYSIKDDERDSDVYHLNRNVIVGCDTLRDVPILKLGDPVGFYFLEWNGDYLKYVGRQWVEADGVYYDKWQKISSDGDPQDYYYLTNIIVDNGELTVSDEEVYEGLAYEVVIEPSGNDWWYIFQGFIEVDGETLDVWYQWNEYEGFSYYSMVTNHIVEAETETHYTPVANLSAWKIKYCLDNDVKKYQWADTVNGKGVIYYMKDEWNNECPYDFKNIQFRRFSCGNNGSIVTLFSGGLFGIKSVRNEWETYPYKYNVYSEGSPFWFYTFNGIDRDTVEYYDMSIPRRVSEATIQYVEDDGGGCDTMDLCYNNKIQPLYLQYFGDDDYDLGQCILNNIVFIGHFQDDGESYPEVGKIYDNTFAVNCSDMTFDNKCHGCNFGEECHGITCSIDFYNNTFGFYCCGLNFGQNDYHNKFGRNIMNSEFVNSCQDNVLEGGNQNIKFDSGCQCNKIGMQSSTITFGMDCSRNILGPTCGMVTLGRGNNCNTFGPYCFSITMPNYCRYMMFDGNDTSISIGCIYQPSTSNFIQNVHIHSGIDNKYIQLQVIGQAYSVDYYANDSQEIYI